MQLNNFKMYFSYHLYCIFICFMYIIGYSYSSVDTKRVLLVTGNFTIDGERSNVAQYDLKSATWSSNSNSQLFLYGEDNGVIWDIAVNYSDPYNRLYTVGLFDTVTKESQVQLCSVARFDGINFEKVGEGLCSRGGDSGSINIQTVVLGNDGDLFVGGNFATRVWDGHHFVYVYHVAQYDAKATAWLPLEGGGELKCTNDQFARVNALVWDPDTSILYIGGRFHSVENRKISSGLAVWSPFFGLESFHGEGVSQTQTDYLEAEITSLAFDSGTKSLFVAGTYTFLNGTFCPSIVVWSRPLQTWRCLFDSGHYLTSISAITMDKNFLYLAGWANSPSWSGGVIQNPYAVARLEVKGLLLEYQLAITEIKDKEREKEKENNKNDHSSNNNNSGNQKNESEPSEAESSENVFGGRRLNSQQNEYDLIWAKLKHRHYKKITNSYRRQLRSHPVVSVGDNNNNSKPTLPPAPVVSPWEPFWDWLPNFPGANGPIMKLVAGKRDLENALFIGGAFDNLPSLLLWNAYPQKFGYGNITAIGGRHTLEGLVTAIAEIFIPIESPSPSSDPTINPDGMKRDYTFVILLACVGLGILLGLCFTLSCFTRFPYPTDPSLMDDENLSAEPQIQTSISLKTLSDGQGNAVDFKECFERAMKFRHLPTYETLIIINPKEILLSKIIGEGSFGRVWSGQWRNNSVAVKEFVFAQAAIAGGSLQRNNIIEEIVGEAGVMACLRHPKILQLYGCSLTMQAIWIVSELCIRGSLKMVLMDHTQDMPILKRLSILVDVADGMQYLHNRTPPIIHRDLKSHNIFISEPSPGNFVAKIGDWGSARAVALTGSKSMTQGVGTACWLSPEVINNAHFSKSSDVYAFGIILWEVYTRQEIYEGLSAAQIIAKVAHEGLRPQVPRHCPWSRIMTQCWKQDPSERPDFEEILSHLLDVQKRYSQKIKERQQHQQQLLTQSAQTNQPSSTNTSIPFSDRDFSGGSNLSWANEDYQKYGSMNSSAGSQSNQNSGGGSGGKGGDSGNNSPIVTANKIPTTPIPPLVPPSVSQVVSNDDTQQHPSPGGNLLAASGKKKSPRFADSFHPSLENIQFSVHDEHTRSMKEPPLPINFFRSSISSSRSIESVSHLAPELAQLEIQSLLEKELEEEAEEEDISPLRSSTSSPSPPKQKESTTMKTSKKEKGKSRGKTRFASSHISSSSGEIIEGDEGVDFEDIDATDFLFTVKGGGGARPVATTTSAPPPSKPASNVEMSHPVNAVAKEDDYEDDYVEEGVDTEESIHQPLLSKSSQKR